MVPVNLGRPNVHENMVQISEGEFLFDLPEVVRAMAVGGHSLRVQFAPGGDPARGWYSALTMGAGMIGMQRGRFPLHGSAITARGRAVAFAGVSSAGKSTLVAALVRAGYPLLADDLCMIRQDEEVYRVGSGVPAVRLLEDAASHLDMRGASAGDIKISVPLDLGEDDVPLSRIYALRFGEAKESPTIRKLSRMEALAFIAQGVRLPIGLDRLPTSWRARNFEFVSGLARQVNVFELSRPRDFASFEKTISLLIEHLEDRRHD